MLRLSRLSDYAIVILLQLGRRTDVQTVPALSLGTRVPEPTVAKLLKVLAAAGVVQSQRGAHGGYRLARRLAELSVADIVTAIDGPIAVTGCVDGARQSCEVGSACAGHGRWHLVNDAVRAALGAITLADLDRTPPRPRAAMHLPLSSTADRG